MLERIQKHLKWMFFTRQSSRQLKAFAVAVFVFLSNSFDSCAASVSAPWRLSLVSIVN